MSSPSITGIICDIRRFGSKGWAIAQLIPDQGKPIRCTGTALSDLLEGVRYQLSGRPVDHPKFGQQFEVRAAEIDLPLDRLAIARHIASQFKNIGMTTAQRIIDKLQPDELETLRDQLVVAPETIDFSRYTKRAVEHRGKGTLNAIVQREFSVRLKAIPDVHSGILSGLGKHYAKKLLRAKDPKATIDDKSMATNDAVALATLDNLRAAWSEFQNNPFRPIDDVSGYTFRIADVVRQALGIPADAPCRQIALVHYALQEGCERTGHCYLDEADLIAAMQSVAPDIPHAGAIALAKADGHTLTIDAGRYYPPALYRAESRLAQKLALRVATPVRPLFKGTPAELESIISAAEKTMGQGFMLDPGQRAAVRGILTSPCSIHTLTAGPGCGKTAIMEIIARIAAARKEMLFCAPTSKAAKVLRSRIHHIGNLEARTIHAMLEPMGEHSTIFRFNANNLLKVDALTSDETSMLDIQISNHLFDAIPTTSHVILLGDTQQLPSIGPGDVLRDLLHLPGLDHHRLHRTHRNQGGLLDVINKAGAGVVDGNDQDCVTFRGPLPDIADESMMAVVYDYDEALALEDGNFAAVGLIIPKRKGTIDTPGWNVTWLNRFLRDRYNPGGIPIEGTSLKVDDRILIRKNQMLVQLHRPANADGNFPVEFVVNGDTGTIREHEFTINEQGTRSLSHLMIALDDGRLIRYPATTINEIDHAYAITCHASQGSEYRRVIFLCTDGPPSFMNRALVFTALSRAKTDLKIWGAIDTLRRICRTQRPPRKSGLCTRVAAQLKQDLHQSTDGTCTVNATRS